MDIRTWQIALVILVVIQVMIIGYHLESNEADQYGGCSSEPQKMQYPYPISKFEEQMEYLKMAMNVSNYHKFTAQVYEILLVGKSWNNFLSLIIAETPRHFHVLDEDSKEFPDLTLLRVGG